MSKKWMVGGGIAVVVVAIAAALLLTTGKSQTPVAPNITAPSGTAANATSTASTSTSSAASGTTTTTGKTGGSSASSTGGGTSSSSGKGGGSGSNASKPKLTPIGPFDPIPDPKLPAVNKTTPAATGEKLAPLANNNKPISGLPLKLLPEGTTYRITMQPYGIGPSSVFGSRLDVLIDSVTQQGGGTIKAPILHQDVLVIANTADGGKITTGGTYAATLTFQSDGSILRPILSKAKLIK